eukprot:93411_1
MQYSDKMEDYATKDELKQLQTQTALETRELRNQLVARRTQERYKTMIITTEKYDLMVSRYPHQKELFEKGMTEKDCYNAVQKAKRWEKKRLNPRKYRKRKRKYSDSLEDYATKDELKQLQTQSAKQTKQLRSRLRNKQKEVRINTRIITVEKYDLMVSRYPHQKELFEKGMTEKDCRNAGLVARRLEKKLNSTEEEWEQHRIKERKSNREYKKTVKGQNCVKRHIKKVKERNRKARENMDPDVHQWNFQYKEKKMRENLNLNGIKNINQIKYDVTPLGAGNYGKDSGWTAYRPDVAIEYITNNSKRNAVLIVNGMESQHRDKKYNDTDAAIRFNELKMQYK